MKGERIFPELDADAKNRTYRFLVLFIGLVMCFLIAAGDFSYGLYAASKEHYFQVVGSSMYPTLEDGQVIRATPLFSRIKRGDIVIFQHESGEDPYVKGVVGIAGDRVILSLRGDSWAVSVQRGYVRNPSAQDIIIAKNYTRHMSAQWIVEEGTVFVMGDNYNDSKDSVTFGPVPLDEIMYLVPDYKSQYYQYLK